MADRRQRIANSINDGWPERATAAGAGAVFHGPVYGSVTINVYCIEPASADSQAGDDAIDRLRRALDDIPSIRRSQRQQ